jgi:hypothetical protein
VADLLDQRVMLGVAQHAGGPLGVARVPVVERAQPGGEPPRRILDRAPRIGRRQRVALGREAGARHQQAALVREVRVVGVPLHAGTLRHHADGGGRRPDGAVQLDRGLDDALPGLGLLRGAALEGVGPGHENFIALICASN